MTEVAFHFNVPDKLAYTCRLLRKATGAGARVVVTASPQTLRQLDTLLWTFSGTDFIAHAMADAPDRVRTASPVLLASELPAQTTADQVLVNLGDQVPAGYDRYPRLIEVVSLDEHDRHEARSRWKHYAEYGHAIVRHDIEQKGDH